MIRALLFFFLFFSVTPSASANDAGLPPKSNEEELLYLREADSAIKFGRFAQAGSLLEWLEKNGSNITADDVYLLRSEYLMIEGQTQSASTMLDNITNLERNICRRQSLEGWIAVSRGETNAAIMKLASATKRCPSNIGAWNLLGLALTEKGEFAAARAAFEQAVERTPQNAALLNNLALVEIADKNYGLAEILMKRAQALSPRNPAISANSDYVAAMLGHMPERQAGESDRHWAERLLHAAEGAKNAKDKNLATAMFSRAVLLLDQYDERAWRQASGESERSEK